jgi:hypothetical protein
MRRWLMAAFAAVVLALGAVATSAVGVTARRSGDDRAMAWIVGAVTVQRIAALDSELARRFFDNSRTFELVGKTTSPLSSTRHELKTMSFADENALRNAIVSHTLLPGTRAVVYDDEDWSLTPSDQQLHPAEYYRMAAVAAHRYGLLLIATPATDLVDALAPGTPKGETYAEFLKLGIAAAAARYADAYEVQEQGAEMSLSKYVQFVRAATAQASGAHPGVESLAGISTNPSGRAQTPSVLLHAVLATRSIVAGYWLNDPAQGTACPRCTGPYPQVAVASLRKLRAS